MKSEVLSKQVYAGLLALLTDNSMYYVSPVDQNYNKLTSEGLYSLQAFVEALAPLMLQVEREDFLERAKLEVWKSINS